MAEKDDANKSRWSGRPDSVRPGHALDLWIAENRSAATNYSCHYFTGNAKETNLNVALHNLETRYVAVVPHVDVSKLIEKCREVFAPDRPAFDSAIRLNPADRAYVNDEEAQEMFIARNKEDYHLYAFVQDRSEDWLSPFESRLYAMSAW